MDFPEIAALLEPGLTRLGLRATPDQLHQIQDYIGELEFWNPRYGLVNVSSREELVVRHILDSLAPLTLFQRLWDGGFRSLADVGSGAGFPGIPLAVFLPEVSVTLIERSGRRCRFLENVRAMMGLDRVEVLEIPLEKIRARHDLVVFRAFSPLGPEVMANLASILNPGGKIAAYKGRREVFEAELATLPPQFKPEIHSLEVPFLSEERHLVLFG